MSNLKKLTKNTYSQGMLQNRHIINKQRILSTKLNRPKTNNNQRNINITMQHNDRIYSASNMKQPRYKTGKLNSSLNFSGQHVLSGGPQG